MGVLRPEEPRLSGCPSLLATLSKAAVRAVQAMNRICVLDVDLQGVRNIKKTDIHPRNTLEEDQKPHDAGTWKPSLT